MTTTTTKAAAWRRAAYVLACYFDGPRDDVEAHILAVIVPSLVRRAEIIERRRKVGR
jgi:hypothetical protein